MTTKFTPDHEYIRVEGDIGTVGITNYAQEQLGDIVFVELPAIGKVLKKGDEAAVVESVKAASEIYAPVSGEVVEVNVVLTNSPGTLNTASEGEGWMFKIRLANSAEIETLLDADGYADLTL
jgi:glycine cleavage system H protein